MDRAASMKVSQTIISDIPPRLGTALREYAARTRDYVLSGEYERDVKDYIASSKRASMSLIRSHVDKVKSDIRHALRGLLLTAPVIQEVLTLDLESKSHYKYLVSLYGSPHLLDQVSAVIARSIPASEAARWQLLEEKRSNPRGKVLYVYRKASTPAAPVRRDYEVIVEIDVTDDVRPLGLVYALDRFLIGLACIEHGLLSAEFDYMRQKGLEIHGPSFSTIGFSLADLSQQEKHEMQEAELGLRWVKEKLREIEPLYHQIVEMSYAIFEGVADWFRRFDIAFKAREPAPTP